MKRSFIALAAMMTVTACATTGTVTAQERARCQEMTRNMGLASRHDHQAERSGATSPMNNWHDRCRAIARAEAADPSN
jgi:hypothetical protein